MEASVVAQREISDDRAQHRGNNHGNIENELAIERLKHTNVVQT